MVGLRVDDPEELPHLGGVQDPRGAQHGGRRALDGGERRAQLVAHHAEELGPQPLQLLERRQVLQGDDHRHGGAVRRPDRGGVDQQRDAPAVGDGEHDLLGLHCFGATDHLLHRELRQRDLAPVGEPACERVQQLLRRRAGRAQPAGQPPGFPVERHGMAGRGVEDGHPDRGGLHQSFEIGSRPLLVAVRPGVGDGIGRLRGEQDQEVLVVGRERLPALLLGEEEVPDVQAPVAHRRRLQAGLQQHQVRGQAERANVGLQVRYPKRSRKVAQVLEEGHRVRPPDHLLLLRVSSRAPTFIGIRRFRVP